MVIIHIKKYYDVMIGVTVMKKNQLNIIFVNHWQKIIFIQLFDE